MIPFPWNLMFRHQVRHVELLNRMGQMLDVGLGSNETYLWVASELREILNVKALTLWVFDRRHQLLVKEAQTLAPQYGFRENQRQFDELLTNWQMEHSTTMALPQQHAQYPGAPDTPAESDITVLSLPLVFQAEVLGCLNLYLDDDDYPLIERGRDPGSSQLLRAVSGQMSVFVHTRSQVSNTTFYKEIHHRVKNNLQTVASLLRMQLRRLDEISAERALEESLQRIMSIALVHETLSQGEIGMVNLLELTQRICALGARSTDAEVRVNCETSQRILVNSKQATAVALVVNELVENAARHGRNMDEEAPPIVEVNLEGSDEQISITVENVGNPLPPGFSLESNSRLGLTIVQTLAKDELKGTFNLGYAHDKNVAKLRFPMAPSGIAGVQYDHEF